MPVDHEHTVESLLRDPEAAADPRNNGLLDRTDLQAIIAQLNATVRELRENCQTLQAERDGLREQLEVLQFQTAISTPLARWDVAMNAT